MVVKLLMLKYSVPEEVTAVIQPQVLVQMDGGMLAILLPEEDKEFLIRTTRDLHGLKKLLRALVQLIKTTCGLTPKMVAHTKTIYTTPG